MPWGQRVALMVGSQLQVVETNRETWSRRLLGSTATDLTRTETPEKSQNSPSFPSVFPRFPHVDHPQAFLPILDAVGCK